ncbi:MAG: YbaK/EbsC family protein [Firmicutes bacterium]|nr:YbaK/EbsC family protein [Bacillota bacterium]
MDILYHHHVVTCAEAAKARKISINEELKTILLRVSHKKISVNIRGSDKINSKAIRKLFNDKHIRFLSEEELEHFNLRKGLVNPWNIPFCEYNLISTNVFEQSFMYTNNSKYTEGIKFLTKELFYLSNIIIGNFSYEFE